MAAADKKQRVPLPGSAAGTCFTNNFIEDYSQKEAPLDFMQRSNAESLVNDAVLALLQARPKDPISFLGDYFGTFLEPKSKLVSAHERIMMNHYTSNIFENNLIDAYKVMQVNSDEKPFEVSPPPPIGFTGEEHNELLMMLTNDMPIKYAEPLLKRIVKPDKQSVSFISFRNDITTTMLYQDFIRISLSVYNDIDFSGKGNANKELCTLFLNELKSLITNGASCEKFKTSLSKSLLKYGVFDSQEKNPMKADEFIQLAIALFLRYS